MGLTAPGCTSDSAELPPPPSQLAPDTMNRPPAKPATRPDTTPVVAMVNGEPITLEELARPMIADEGWTTLVCLLQLHVARQAAARQGISVTDADIQAEYKMTLAAYFADADPADYDHLLEALLPKMTPPMTRPQFLIAVQSDAYFRKLVANDVARFEKGIEEKRLQEMFDIRYGSKVQVRFIEVPTRQDAERAKARLEAGEPFTKLAAELNISKRLRESQGLWEPFNIHTSSISQPLVKTAFLLDDGQVSDIVQGTAAYYLIKMESHIKPKLVKYENVRDALKEEMLQSMIQARMSELRNTLTQQALGEGLVVEDPQLKEIWQEGLRREKGTTNQEILRKKILEEQKRSTGEIGSPPQPAPASQPASQPALPPAATQPGHGVAHEPR